MNIAQSKSAAKQHNKKLRALVETIIPGKLLNVRYFVYCSVYWQTVMEIVLPITALCNGHRFECLSGSND